ncbi:two-component system, OmpR family, response regulator MprA/putative two-component system response regulator [Mucilaginibacter gossypiicola]|uniref:Two-component system, OmpR family, response regulator MprA/putative two-component system response regulator n=1 Tax=Mucilaginibacter gossypiicola TaxID=551995 RepID=A0A1H7ZNE9_9SPHI|nr:response regulator [Mucilaginibacter gossypiicola]SEM59078.1 two-component system, OmpR family, response regulator MprA/putative two-component system response regulator [Mucilaginibacter gossypiicola]
MDAKNKKIMIADDDPGIVDAVEMLLEFEGYEVTSTVDGATVLDMKDELPDLLLLDIWMSGEDGRDICKKLKQNELTKDIPVIMISASRDIRDSAMIAGADDFLAKPFDMDELLKKVAHFVQKTNITQQ